MFAPFHRRPPQCTEREKRNFSKLYSVAKSGHFEGLRHPFKSTVRIRLVRDIIEASAGAVAKLVLKPEIRGFFPLHVKRDRDKLINNYVRHAPMPWRQPIEPLRHYFGDEMALYFAYLAAYTTWLLPSAILASFWIRHTLFCVFFAKLCKNRKIRVPKKGT